MMQWLNLLAGTCIVAPDATGRRPAQAAELIVRSSMGAISGLNELGPAFTRLTGHKLIVIQESRTELEQRLTSDAPADLIVQTTSVMDGVIGRGKVVKGSSVIFARAAVGLSVKSGAPWPDIGTPEAFKRTLLAAGSIVYSLGGSGLVAARAIEKLGIAGQMKSRTVHSDGGPAAGYVARGEAEMAIQQLNVSKPVAGTDYVGNLPGDLHEYVVFAVAIMAVSKEQEAARAFIRFVASPEATPLLKKGMMEPASR
ncbi:MAG TPA: molybdate ABC transporter substrate-binding protein [Burkholderiales bacterium]|jgi:molybdate transport system substrate-binding protein|nr:molybdate ABC transporter substrate-binding protein [Burkholderiales bacterium]